MSEIRYMISDAARQAGVEAHVLRSWEEELDIKVGRTELGHRYYTDKTIYIMKKVKELRDKGFQLKAIKVLIPEIQKKAEEITEIAEEKNAVMKDTATKTEKAEHTEKTDSDANLKDSTCGAGKSDCRQCFKRNGDPDEDPGKKRGRTLPKSG